MSPSPPAVHTHSCWVELHRPRPVPFPAVSGLSAHRSTSHFANFPDPPAPVRARPTLHRNCVCRRSAAALACSQAAANPPPQTAVLPLRARRLQQASLGAPAHHAGRDGSRAAIGRHHVSRGGLTAYSASCSSAGAGAAQLQPGPVSWVHGLGMAAPAYRKRVARQPAGGRHRCI